MNIPYENLYLKLDLVLKSKVEELYLNNYRHMTKEKVWRYCIEKKFRNKAIQELPIHRIVHAVLSISASDMMLYEQVKEHKAASFTSNLNEEEIKALLKPLVSSEKPSE